uniref:Uncharacterized protein n=1 Tax=Desertifilum tharense IPPAS B-1220 TaxID=1781255 RepID=A0ACD5GY37_9CYAN
MFVRRVSFVALLAILLGGTGAIAFAQPMPEVFQIAQQGREIARKMAIASCRS